MGRPFAADPVELAQREYRKLTALHQQALSEAERLACECEAALRALQAACGQSGHAYRRAQAGDFVCVTCEEDLLSDHSSMPGLITDDEATVDDGISEPSTEPHLHDLQEVD